MSLQGISRTAIAAAIARAAHQIFDGDPKLLTDPLALTFVDDATREALRARKPAIMTMAGKSAWWVPKWADRFLPQIDIDGTQLDEGEGTPRRAKRRANDSMKL